MDVRIGPTRRDMIAGSLAAVGLSAAGLPASIAHGATATHTTSVGDIDLTILSDGFFNIPSRLLSRDTEVSQIEAVLGDTLAAPGMVQYAVNVVLLRRGSELIIIDAGAGSTWKPSLGKLGDRLQQAAIDPKRVTRVIVTHAHPDHIWGLVDEFDELRFPNADYVMPATEIDYWRKVDVDTLPGHMQGVAVGAKRVIGEIGERLRAAPADAEIQPGISYIATPGHTPGHCSVRLTSGSDGVIVTADAVFHPNVSFAHPDWQPVSDMDGARAASSRRRLLDMAATDKLQLISYHIAFPGLGRVERHGTAYRWLT